jgi:hypothetical protein
MAIELHGDEMRVCGSTFNASALVIGTVAQFLGRIMGKCLVNGPLAY